MRKSECNLCVCFLYILSASQSVRENYGGSVSVGGEGGKGRGSGEGGRGRSGKGRGGSGRGRSSSNRRDKEERDGKKEEKQRGERGERGGRSRNKAPRGARARARAAAAEPGEGEGGRERDRIQCWCLFPERAVEEKGGEDKPRPLPVALETWDDEIDPQPSTEWDDHRKVNHQLISITLLSSASNFTLWHNYQVHKNSLSSASMCLLTIMCCIVL